MLITALVKENKKVRVFLNDDPAFCLYPAEVRSYGLREGEELPDALRERIYKETLVRRAKLRCMHLLKRADQTEWQLREKLRKDGHPPEVIEEAVSYVKEQRYVDDRRYAERYIELHSDEQSRRQMRAALLRRGVESGQIEEALSQVGEDEEERLISYWIEKKRFDPSAADQKERARFCAFLLRKGISWTRIRRHLDAADSCEMP